MPELICHCKISTILPDFRRQERHCPSSQCPLSLFYPPQPCNKMSLMSGNTLRRENLNLNLKIKGYTELCGETERKAGVSDQDPNNQVHRGFTM
ncbi:hypothetical protein TNIN_137901 [Trichonephila inaurata madagascariensis]|uniref:Uncharacterized protein n=1 Tax=Trichonephila inaurata madagascariensis TaxID=2747483 RepID=A0A8X6Y4A3_9ARAC|nr:hypothetical protein TNIN_137901 [Trichonephila inaurata madagascariensis]